MITDLLGEILDGNVPDGLLHDRPGFGTAEKLVLGATAVGGYAVARVVFALVGLPSVPGYSALLISQSWYAWPVVTALLVGLTLLARPLTGRVRFDAPLFCAAIAVGALPTHGGDARNALLDSGSAAVYVKMIIEQLLLCGTLLAGYAALYRPPASPAVESDVVDTVSDRGWTVGTHTLIVLALLALSALSPLKGQTLLSCALAGGIASAVTFRAQRVAGSVWYVAGTMLCGIVAYAWTGLHPDGIAIGDASGLLAGPARVLPLHYATAGVAGTLYGYWIARTWAGEAEA